MHATAQTNSTKTIAAVITTQHLARTSSEVSTARGYHSIEYWSFVIIKDATSGLAFYSVTWTSAPGHIAVISYEEAESLLIVDKDITDIDLKFPLISAWSWWKTIPVSVFWAFEQQVDVNARVSNIALTSATPTNWLREFQCRWCISTSNRRNKLDFEGVRFHEYKCSICGPKLMGYDLIRCRVECNSNLKLMLKVVASHEVRSSSRLIRVTYRLELDQRALSLQSRVVEYQLRTPSAVHVSTEFAKGNARMLT